MVEIFGVKFSLRRGMPGRVFCERKIAVHCIVTKPEVREQAILRAKLLEIIKVNDRTMTYSSKQDCLSNQFQLF